MNPPDRVLAEFAAHEHLVQALRRLRAERYTHLEVYSPFPSDEIDELLPGKPTPVGWAMLAGGIAGGSGAYFMQWFAARDFPYNSGGRPLDSWPAFVPVTFEMTVLTAALTGLVALLWLARLPRLDHPVFAGRGFERASRDRYFIAIRTDDPRLTQVGLGRLLRECEAISVQEVAG